MGNMRFQVPYLFIIYILHNINYENIKTGNFVYNNRKI